MNKELQTIIANLENVLDGEPWYGRPVYELLGEANPSLAHAKPSGNNHSLADLLYHMLTWTQFTLAAAQEKPAEEVRAFEDLDWRYVHHLEHTWEKGLQEFKETNRQLIALLKTKDDSLLDKTVPARKYNYRYLLNGLIQHDIYHIGQVAYRTKEF